MIYDLLIVGAGPAGLSTAIEAQQVGLKYVVIEKGGIVHSIQNFPAGMTFFSTPELLEIGNIPFTSSLMRPTRTEGLEYYTRVANYYALNCRFFESVTGIASHDSLFTVTSSRSVYQTKNVVLATGYFDHPNKMEIPGEQLPKVTHYYDEPFAMYRQHVLVIGAKNSAAIAAVELYRHGAFVTLVHRGEKLSEKIKYWILPDLENRIKEKSINALFNTRVVEIKERSVRLENSNGPFEIENDFVYALTGYHPDYGFLLSCGVELDKENSAPTQNPDTHETNIHGIYVAGSIVAGKNNNSIFIENGKLHGKRIIESIKKTLAKE